MRSVLDCDVRIWPKACPKCQGDLRLEDDPYWPRFVCWQCGRSFPTAGSKAPEELIDLMKNGGPGHGRRPKTY